MKDPGQAEISVPASAANLGPGFDALGLALELRNVYKFEPAPFDIIEASGKFAQFVPHDTTRNLAFRAFRSIAPPGAGPYRLHATRVIPAQGGLGSSGSAIVGGLSAANHAFGLRLSDDDLLSRAIEMEGHADNVAPALLGGLVVVVKNSGEPRWVRLSLPTSLGLVLLVPDYRVPTYRARSALPESVPLQDAVANLSRVALLIAALAEKQYDVLRVATQDFLHQPYRKALNPALDPCMHAALDAGGYGASLSGSGPTIVAFVPKEKNISVASAMADACHNAGHGCETYVVGPAVKGSHPVEASDPS